MEFLPSPFPRTFINVKAKLKNESGFNKHLNWISKFIHKSSTALFEDTTATKCWNTLPFLLPQKVTSRSFGADKSCTELWFVTQTHRQKPGNRDLWLTCHPELRQALTALAKAQCQLLFFEIPGLDEFVKTLLSLFPFLFSAAPGTTCYLPSLSSEHTS